MKLNSLFIIFAMLFSFSANAEETRLNKYTGSEIETPFWFKDSFLDIADDIQEAQEEGNV